MKEWSDRSILAFDSQWIQEDVLVTKVLLRPLHMGESGEEDADILLPAAAGR